MRGAPGPKPNQAAAVASSPGILKKKNEFQVQTCNSFSHRRRIKTEEEEAKVVAVGWETYLNAALTVKQ